MIVSQKTAVRTGETTYPFKALNFLGKTNLKMVPPAGLEPARPKPRDFKSPMSTIPPRGHGVFVTARARGGKGQLVGATGAVPSSLTACIAT